MLNVKKLIAKTLNALNPTTVTLTRTNNAYVDATSFSRLLCYRFGRIGVLLFNLQITTTMPNGTSLQAIGTMSKPPVREIVFNVPSQGSNATILVQILENGTISIANQSGTASGTSFFRAVVPIVF